MADIVAESRASTKDYSIPHGLLNDTVAQAGKRVQKAALEISERSAKVLQEHPVGITSAATSALCLAGLCLKTPEIREVAKDVAEIVSTRAV
ncbi:hypothetical protein NQ283_28730, partial [Escherichia coli]|nr:hypothetical protein [Escherichia coli]